MRKLPLDFISSSILEVDPDAVCALRPFVELEQPEWVEPAKREWEGFRDIESVSFWAEMPIQVVVAILLNLDERRELETDVEPLG